MIGIKAYKCKSNQERLLLIKDLVALGWELDLPEQELVKLFEEEDFKKFPCVGINEEEEVIMFYTSDEVERFIIKSKILVLLIKPIVIELNSSYRAIVYKNKIEVGCQEFTHEKIEELYKASCEMKG